MAEKLIDSSVLLSSYLAGPTVKIIVGCSEEQDLDDGSDRGDVACTGTGQEQTFIVHEQLLVAKPPFFANALKAHNSPTKSSGDISWMEGETGIVRLPSDDPAIFAKYLSLLYNTDSLTLLDLAPPSTNDPQTTDDSQTVPIYRLDDYGTILDILSRLYIFCEKIQDASTKQTLLTAMVRCSSTEDRYSPGAAAINRLYDGTVAGDPARLFVQHCALLRGGGASWVKEVAKFTAEFLRDFVAMMWEEPPCAFGKVTEKRLVNARRYCRELFAAKAKDRDSKGDIA